MTFPYPNFSCEGRENCKCNKVPNEGAGNKKNVISLTHSLAHIENVAIDLSWDIITRSCVTARL